MKQELDLCDSDARVFKLIGPALMQQNLKEAKENVNNRIKYITDEIKRQEETIKDIEKKMELHREAINGINREKALRQKSGGSSVQSAS
jgi:prefoldin beta subunit